MICSDGAGITRISLAGENTTHIDKNPCTLTDKAAAQLEEYLAGQRQNFDFPVSPEGTAFQQSVWKYLCTIPYGETRSYKQAAVAIGNPKAFRAVGMACNRNPIMIVIPCHRIVGTNKKLVGYAGGLELKKRLLQLELAGHALSTLEQLCTEQLTE